MKRNKLTKRAMSCLALTGLMQSFTATATPLPSSKFKLDGPSAAAIARDPLLKSAKILKDHATNVLYVAPASQKVQAGTFVATAPIECDRYRGLYELTFKMPANNQEARAMVDRLESTGPYFDQLYGNYALFTDIIRKAYYAAVNVEAWRAAHLTELEEVGALEIRIANLDAQIRLKDQQLEPLNRELMQANLAMLRTPLGSPERAQAEAAYTAVYNRVIGSINTLEAEKLALNEQRLPLDLERQLLQNALDSSKPMDYDEAMELASKARRAMNDLNSDAATAQSNLVSALDTVETKTVGFATASYTVWGEEQARLAAILAANNSPYAAQRLPIFNVNFIKSSPVSNSSSVVQNSSAEQLIGGQNINKQVSTFGIRAPEANSSFQAGSFAQMFDRVNNKIVDVGIREKKVVDNSFTFNSLITQGLYCSGKSERDTSVVNWGMKNDLKATLTRTLIPAKRTHPVLSQSVKVKYDYYEKTDPIAVTCSLQIDKFESFARNAGSNRFLFWGKKWDHAERERVNNNGLYCNLDTNAQAGTPQVDSARTQEIYQSLMQDLAADYILNFASDYDVIATQPVGPIMNEGGQYAQSVGPAMTTLCGANVYCQIANVVFTALDELIEARSGKISREDTQRGTMTRSYSERSYTIAKDESLSTFEVRL
jgi:hypothetical protein